MTLRSHPLQGDKWLKLLEQGYEEGKDQRLAEIEEFHIEKAIQVMKATCEDAKQKRVTTRKAVARL